MALPTQQRAKETRSRTVLIWGIHILTWIPPILIFFLMVKFRSSFWQLDCQRIIKIVTDVSSGEGSWLHYFDHINAHRQPVTMIVYATIGWCSNWNDLAFAVITYILAAISFICLALIVKRIVQDSFTCLWITMLGSWVVFSPLRMSNWLMSWGIMWPLLDAFLWAGLALAVSRVRWPWKNVACGVCALLGSHVLLQGLLYWGVFPLALYAGARAEGWQPSKRWWVLWGGCGFIVAASYFNFGLTTIKTWGDAESSIPGLFTGAVAAASSMVRFGLQIATAYGSPLGPTVAGIPAAALVPGFTLFTGLLMASWSAFRRWQQDPWLGVWAGVVLYGLASCFLIMIGRHQLAWLEGYASLSRYHYASLFLVFGTVAMGFGKENKLHRLFAIVIFTLVLQAGLTAVALYPETRSTLAYQRAVFPLEVLSGTYVGSKNFADVPQALARRGIYNTSLLSKEDLRNKVQRGTNSDTLAGAIESVSSVRPQDSWIVRGWAAAQNSARKPDAVALFLVSPEVRLLAFSSRMEHSEAASHYRSTAGADAAGWTVTIPDGSLPQVTSRLQAFVVDGQSGEFRRVGAEIDWRLTAASQFSLIPSP